MVSPRQSRPIRDRSQLKRLRRGTHSCWECKRRKMKCEFDPRGDGSTVCIGCKRRGSACISQEFPEEPSRTASSDSTASSTDNVDNWNPTKHFQSEALDISFKASKSIPNPQDPHTARAYKSPASARSSDSNYNRLSKYLCESLPSRDTIERIYKVSPNPSILAHEVMTMPYTSLIQNDLENPQQLRNIPKHSQHPVLIARYMFLLASFLQHVLPDSNQDTAQLSESESPTHMSERLADMAINLVTTKDELVGSIEGLDCIIIESVYQANGGNLRRSWIANRRAMTIAQMMGLDRSDNRTQFKTLDHANKQNPQITWFRIVFLDRFLSLLLGLPQGCLTPNMEAGALLASDIPMERLEKIHCIVASKILQRNESEPCPGDLALTKDLDLELQRAARSLPSKWWLVPKLEALDSDPQALFRNTRRLFAQALHYNLVNQLHLPYMLSAQHSNKYSQITCVNASRETLARFVALRCCDGAAYSCRIIDFLALMAAITLLLAHLCGQADPDNFIAHQYHSDFAMIEQVQDSMAQFDHFGSNALNKQSAELLQRLLAIATETTTATGGHSRQVRNEAQISNIAETVSVHVPYFGVIQISRDGVSMERYNSQITSSGNHRTTQEFSTQNSATTCNQSQAQVSSATIQSVPSDMYSQSGTMLSPETGMSTLSPNPIATPQYQPSVPDQFLQQGYFPELAAGGANWAFQGVDLALFDSLFGGTEKDSIRFVQDD